MKTNNETSYQTSRRQIARTYKMFADVLANAETVLDYGSGKYHEDLYEYHKANGINGTLYEPYNEAINVKPNRKFEVVICNNVLNVLESDDTMMEVIVDCLRYATKKVIFCIYEGDRDGVGKVRTSGTFQRNTKAKDYMKYFEGLNVKRKRNFIIIEK